MKRTILIILSIIVSTLCYANKNIEKELQGIEHKLYFYPSEGEVMLDNLLNSHDKGELEKYQGQIQFLYGLLAYEKADLDSSIACLERGLISFIKEDNKLYQAKSQIIIGWVSEKLGCFLQAKLNYYKAIELVDEKHAREMGMGYLGVGRCRMYLMEDFNEEMKKGAMLLRSLNKEEYALYADYLLWLSFNQQKLDEIIRIADRYLELGIKRNAASVYKSIASYYKKNADFDSSLIYIDKAILLSIPDDYPAATLTSSLYQFKALVYYLQNDYVKAREYCNLSIELNNDYKPHLSKQYAYNCLYRIDTIQGDFQTGFLNLSKAREYEKLSTNITNRQLTKIMEVSNDLKLVTNEIEGLNTKRKYDRLLFVLIITFVLSIFVIMWLINNNRNKQKVLQEKIEKHELQKLISNLGEVQLLKKNYSLKHDDQFKDKTLDEQFELACAQTINKLKNEFKELTDNDARYAAMFAMDTSDSVIAKIRNINTRSVLKSKSRIREKLGLEMGTDLHQYFLPYI